MLLAVKPSDIDNRRDASRMANAMAAEALQDIITSADLLQDAIITDAPLVQQEDIRETARSQFEGYLDLMATAATHARALKP